MTMRARSYDPELQDAAELEAGLYTVFGESLAEATPESVERMLARALQGATPAQAESIGRSLRDVGRWATSNEVRQTIGGALPLVGGVVGTMYGGPVGAALGSQAGQLAAGAVTSNNRPMGRAAAPSPARPAAVPASQPRPATPPPASPAPAGGSQSA